MDRDLGIEPALDQGSDVGVQVRHDRVRGVAAFHEAMAQQDQAGLTRLGECFHLVSKAPQEQALEPALEMVAVLTLGLWAPAACGIDLPDEFD